MERKAILLAHLSLSPSELNMQIGVPAPPPPEKSGAIYTTLEKKASESLAKRKWSKQVGKLCW